MDINKRDLATKAALLYYDHNYTQNDIAKELGISRSYVSSLINYAREIGVININVKLDFFSLRALQEEILFQKQWGKVKRVYIMRSDNEEFTAKNLGVFAAPFVADWICFANCIGINPGVSVERTVSQLPYQNINKSVDKKVVQMMGGFHVGHIHDPAQPNEIVQQLGHVLGCDVFYINAPAFVQQKRLYTQLMRERSIASVTQLWRNIDLAIMGLGVADDSSKFCQMLDAASKELLVKSGACGMLNTTFFDCEGNLLDLFAGQNLGVRLQDLNQVPKIVICSGASKVKALYAALKGGFVDVLITDTLTLKVMDSLQHAD